MSNDPTSEPVSLETVAMKKADDEAAATAAKKKEDDETAEAKKIADNEAAAAEAKKKADEKAAILVGLVGVGVYRRLVVAEQLHLQRVCVVSPETAATRNVNNEDVLSRLEQFAHKVGWGPNTCRCIA